MVEEVQVPRRRDPRADPDVSAVAQPVGPVLARIALARRAVVAAAVDERPAAGVHRALPGPGLAWCVRPDAQPEALPLL